MKRNDHDSIKIASILYADRVNKPLKGFIKIYIILTITVSFALKAELCLTTLE